MKTTSELNEKWWYRLGKVVFILSFVISLVASNGIVFSEVGLKNLDLHRTQIACSIGDGMKIFNPADEDVYLYESDFKDQNFEYRKFFQGYNDNEILKIVGICTGKDTNSMDVFSLQKGWEIKKEKTNFDDDFTDEEHAELNKIYKLITNGDKSASLNWNHKMFDVSPEYTYNEFLLYFFGGNVGIIVFFEVLRRIFYYVVLGSVRPKKS